MNYLLASVEKPVKFLNAGIFISPTNEYKHGTRVINSFELIYIIDSMLYLAEENEKFEAEKGDIIVLYPGLTHYGYKYSGKNTSFFWAHFLLQGKYEYYNDIDCIDGISYHLKNPYYPQFQNKILLPKYAKQFENERIIVLYHSLLHIQQSNYYTSMATDLHMTDILIEITNQLLEKLVFKSDNNGNEVLLSYIMKCIKLNYLKAGYSIKDIGAELGYNTDYIARVFKKKMNTTISKYINSLRIEKAKKLLLESFSTVTEIAYDIGFRDEKYFMKLFKEYENMSPTEFRNTYYKGHYNIR